MQIHEELYANCSSWEEAYYKHEKRVKKFFDEKKSDEYIEMDICGGEGWDKLCSFMGVKQPTENFPHRNKSTE
jgi:hypothetical protein